MNAQPPVHGLILAGGASTRMRRDKAALEYGGEGQLDRAYAMAQRHVPDVFVSVRADQIDDPVRARHPLIVDAYTGGGPIVGIRSALARRPAVAWLVLACDLPFLSDAVLARLLHSRDPARFATAYRSAHDGLPEPLCAIWEPAAADALARWQAEGHDCPRRFLDNHRAMLVEPVDGHALDNINTPEEYARARAAFDSSAAPDHMQIKVHYYALMREQAGRSDELLDTVATTPAELYRELGDRHRFSLPPERLKVAVNGEFSDWLRPLRSGDVIVFIPPVAGG
ncbi:MAG TPA: NTP transferase domain-containing protein [Steroidobacteraceae bacterium]|nr:NTP transferase domain-containing protein [Steroidobacteraceae bacterium]